LYSVGVRAAPEQNRSSPVGQSAWQRPRLAGAAARRLQRSLRFLEHARSSSRRSAGGRQSTRPQSGPCSGPAGTEWPIPFLNLLTCDRSRRIVSLTDLK